MTTEENQPQVDVEPKAEQAEVETPQPAEAEVEAPSEAEKEPQAEPSAEPVVEEKPPSERTFSQAEVSKIEGKLQEQVSGLTTHISQIRMQQQIAELEQFEKEAASDDKALVDEGQITVAQADQRRDARSQQREQQKQSAQQMQAAQQMFSQAEQVGRVLAARDFGEKYKLSEVEIAGLLSDKEIKTPEAMETRATNLALERTQGELKTAQATPQQFDQGQTGSRGSGNPDRIIGEYGQGLRTRAEYEAAMKAKGLNP